MPRQISLVRKHLLLPRCIAVVLSFSCCLAAPWLLAEQRIANSQLERLGWVLGSWKRETAKSTTVETWRRLSTRTLEGESVRTPKDSAGRLFTESLLLAEMGNNEVFYIAKIAENPYPVAFKLTSLDEGEAIFENPGHDFPQRVRYKRNADGSMTAAIEGKTGAEADSRRVEFHFVREAQ